MWIDLNHGDDPLLNLSPKEAKNPRIGICARRKK